MCTLCGLSVNVCVGMCIWGVGRDSIDPLTSVSEWGPEPTTRGVTRVPVVSGLL